MSKPEKLAKDMVQIMALMQTHSPNIMDLCDLVYHYNKSLGLTYTAIREEIVELSPTKRFIALENFLKVINELKTPQLFIQIDD